MSGWTRWSAREDGSWRNWSLTPYGSWNSPVASPWADWTQPTETASASDAARTIGAPATHAEAAADQKGGKVGPAQHRKDVKGQKGGHVATAKPGGKGVGKGKGDRDGTHDSRSYVSGKAQVPIDLTVNQNRVVRGQPVINKRWNSELARISDFRRGVAERLGKFTRKHHEAGTHPTVQDFIVQNCSMESYIAAGKDLRGNTSQINTPQINSYSLRWCQTVVTKFYDVVEPKEHDFEKMLNIKNGAHDSQSQFNEYKAGCWVVSEPGEAWADATDDDDDDDDDDQTAILDQKPGKDKDKDAWTDGGSLPHFEAWFGPYDEAAKEDKKIADEDSIQTET
jgi:hypothetical protein